MTENEIVKELELALSDDAPVTENCPCTISKLAAKEILDFINLKKVETEWLNKEVDRLSLEVLYSDGNMRSMLRDVVDKLKTGLIGWDTDPTDEEIEYTIVNVANEIMEEWGLIIEEGETDNADKQ